MSEQGWRAFLAAEGVGDWVVLHGGACAVFEAGSLPGAARVAGLVAQVPGIDEGGAVLTISHSRLSVRLTRDVWDLDEQHIAHAREISRVAERAGAVAVRGAVQEVQVAIAAHAEDVDLGFWRAVLGYQGVADDNAVDPLGHGSTVWMQTLDDAKALRHAMHIDVSVPREEAEKRVAAAVAAGGTVVVTDDTEATWILSDRAGNKVCVVSWPDGGTPGGQ